MWLWCRGSIQCCLLNPLIVTLAYWWMWSFLRKLLFAKAEPTVFAVARQAPLRVWCGISAGLSVEVATTMATSRHSEWDKTPVRSGHASSRCLLKWEVLVSLTAMPLSFFLMPCFWKRKLLKGPLQPSTHVFQHHFLFLVTLPWDEAASLSCCALS